MARRISKGKCNLCGETFSKAAMTKHLESCKQRKAASETPSKKWRSQQTKLLHLVVEGHHLPEYWLHLEVRADATLKDLDGFLRDIWLECCGHMSAFTIAGNRYYAPESEGLDGESMDIALGKVLRPGTKFDHEYDFGTTTALALRVVSEREGELKGKPIQLLARNDPPLIPCAACGKTATQVCSVCIYEGEGGLCDECALKHECDEEMFLPVVNSPRVGMCGYTG